MKTLIHIVGKARTSPCSRVLLAAWLVAVCLSSFSAEVGTASRYPLMSLTPEQTQQMMADHVRATPLSASANVTPAIAFLPSFTLLPLLPYIPAQRNQGGCGDCWAWAGTGVMEIAHAVNNGVRNRLSVQLLNSCNPYVSCCNGGWLTSLADFYSYEGFSIPWTNTYASFLSTGGSCSSALCGSIATTPRYPIAGISVASIPTWGIGPVQAIANIKSTLLQSNAVWFAFFMATQTDWNNFFNFWDYQPESSQWTTFYPGQTPTGSEGHAVLCVGYDDTDPAGPCWIMVNSWGTTPGRPNGVFRVSQALNYGSTDSTGFNLLYWETLRVQFVSPPSPPTLTLQLAGANSVILSWPASATGFTLQQNSALGTPNWVNVNTAPTVASGQNQVVLSTANGKCFFRLVSP
jgi:hypothetical protein